MSNQSSTQPLKYVGNIKILPLFFKELQGNVYPPTGSHFSQLQVTQFDSLSMFSGSVTFSKAEL